MTIQPKPSKVIFEIIEIEGFYRIRKSQFYSGDEGNPPLVKTLKYRTFDKMLVQAAIARCGRAKVYEGYSVLFDVEKGELVCELTLNEE